MTIHSSVRRRRSAAALHRASSFAACEPLEGRMLLAAPIVNSVWPLSLGSGAGVSTEVSAAFDQAMSASTINASTVQLRTPGGATVSARVSYNPANNRATLDPASPLAYGTTYTATVKGGSSGVKNAGGEALASDVSWTFTTAAAPTTGPGGPILVITTSANPFSSYYAEILRMEGLNEFATADISTVNSTLLSSYDVAILGQMSLSSAQVTTLSNWVNAGGNLIAMRPDKQLAGLLGLSDTGFVLPEGYLLVNTAASPGAGITDQTIQYHGTADQYIANSAISIATLYSNATTSTPYPAVTIRNVGSNGGQAAAFTYDLARSIVYTRQGNPAWSGQERDGFAPIRSDDLFYPDYVDLSKIAIPQADEQQRLLANLIGHMNADRKPLPRFWYLPDGAKAAVFMSGDDHANGGTPARFNTYEAASNPSGSVADWEKIRSTSYVYPGTPISDAQAAAYTAMGFEVALHVDTFKNNYTSFADLDSYYTTQLAAFSSKYASIPMPQSNRTHAIVWSDYVTQAEVEFSHRIRLDANYYFWPPGWVQNQPGLFTGSAMPMRFASAGGSMIDVYQAVTQMTDESEQTYPFTINTLLDRALGSEGYYGVFTANMHTDDDTSADSDAIIASAKARGVPVISGKQLLDWLDGRNSSSFESISWNSASKTLSFAVKTAVGAHGLTAMIPVKSGTLNLSVVRQNGSPVTFSTQTIKGVEYAFVPVQNASYTASYAADSTAPIISGVSATPASNGQNATIAWTTNEPADSLVEYGTSASNLNLSASDPAGVTGHSIGLTGLSPNTTYYYRVRSADLSGNGSVWPALANPPATFTTPVASYSIWNEGASPTTPSANDTSAVELGVKFRANVDGFINGIRFYKGTANTGTHIANLWTRTGTLLASATFTNETASGWQTATFAQPVAIAANTTYVASYHTSVGRYAADLNYFASSATTNGPLQALQNGVDGGNGVYRYGTSSGFPTNTYFATNYWVDVVFSTASAPPPVDTTPPSLTGRSPAPGATGVAASANVTATFSESVVGSTISFVLRDSANNIVPASVSYNDSTRTVTLDPSSSLSNLSTYTATLSGAQDAAGNTMSTVSWAFTTEAGAPVQNTYTIWSDSTVPSLAGDSDTSAVELGVKFRANVDGFINGIRFYKGTANTGTHIANLWTRTGTLLASATFTNETASGWQTATFAQPVAIAANTTYVASYHTSVGRYAADLNYFASSATTNGPLQALQNGVDGGNGVYRYGTSSGFPTNTYFATNYWVDVVFSTASAPPPPADTTPPSLTGRSPAPGATGVAASANVTATFSESVVGSTISFVLRDSANNTVPASVSYNDSTRTVTLDPSSSLSNLSTYTATLSGAQDAAGNTMSAVSWAFTTEPGGTWQQTTAADFAAGTLNGTVVTNTSGGEVQLAGAGFSDEFSGTALSSAWTTSVWTWGTGTASVAVSNGILALGRTLAMTAQSFPLSAVEARLDLGASAWRQFGLATSLTSTTGNYWATFTTKGTTTTLYARVNVSGTVRDLNIGALPTGFHVYRIQPVATGFEYYVDGAFKARIDLVFPAGTQLRVILSALNGAPQPLLRADWVHMASYSSSGTFISSVFDAGATAKWGAASWLASLPAGTSILVETSSGNTAVPDASWSSWAAVSNGGSIASPAARYLRYRVTLSTSDAAVTPVLTEILFGIG